MLENGIKLRTKSVTAGDIFLDFGEIHSKELEIYNEFYDFLKKYPDALRYVEETISTFDESQKKKHFLKIRDRMLSKINRENKFHYQNGALDSLIIEMEVKKIINSDYVEIEKLDFIEFERRKLDFKKDSLKEFLYVAVNELK